jgi:membrane-associated phospholipid phosphatase
VKPAREWVARWASILIHPVMVMLVAAAIATGVGDPPPGRVWQALGLTLAAAAVVMIYGVRQIRSGRWTHIDASQPHERSQFNRFASWVLLGLAAICAVAGADRGVVVVIALSGVIVLVGHVLRGQLKLSLHVAFAMFAACIAWPQAVAFAGLLAATVVVAWSRLVLRRHGVSDVLAGAATGLACGVVFQVVFQCADSA